jgi:hypothetical protein
MQPGDLIAVIRTGAGSGPLEQFTSEKRVLVSLIDGLRWNPNGRSGISLFEPIGMYSDLAQRLSAGLPNGAESSLDVRYEIRNRTISTVGTLGAISRIVDARLQGGAGSYPSFAGYFALFPTHSVGHFPTWTLDAHLLHPLLKTKTCQSKPWRRTSIGRMLRAVVRDCTGSGRGLRGWSIIPQKEVSMRIAALVLLFVHDSPSPK